VSDRFSARFEILPPRQRELWPSLRGLAGLGFVLYGGTAIALRLGHRQSVDFDFFTERRLVRRALNEQLPILRTATVLQEAPDTLTVLATAGGDSATTVKLSFFGGIDFGRVGSPQWTDDGVAWVASREDLLATKLKVILQRAESRDYFDIATLLRAGVELPFGLASARALFGAAFQPAECLKALTWFQDGDLPDLGEETRTLLIEAAGAVRELPKASVLSRALAGVTET
jgi:hypothetical protein